MSLNFNKFVGAALLALAIVGGTAAYLTSSLYATPAHVAFDGVTTEQPAQPAQHAEVIVTEGQAS